MAPGRPWTEFLPPRSSIRVHGNRWMTGTTAPRSWSLSPGRALARPGAFIVTRALHWAQGIAQLMVYVWWARYVPIVGAFAPFIVAQLIFAYAVDGLLNWSR